MNDLNRSSIGLYLLYLMTIVGAITVTGALGFQYFEAGHNPNVKGYWDCFWWTMVTVTTIGYGDIYPVTVGGRIIAIFLMFAGIGILEVSTAAVAAYFIHSDQLQMLRIRTLRDHVVICGLGEKGLLLARAFRERGFPVLVIEKDETNDLIDSCEEQGAIVMLGSATEIEMLHKCRVQEAKYLIAVCGDDGANAEITARGRELSAKRPGKVLTCASHIVDPELWYLLRRWEIDSVGSFRLQFFNVYDIGARALLQAHPPFDGLPRDASPHLLVVGAGRLGQNLVVAAARLWRDRSPPAGRRMRATFVDRETARLKDDLYLRHHGLETTCEIDTRSIDPRSAEFHQAAFLFDERTRRMTVTAVYVCIDDDAAGLSAALSLLHHVRERTIPIVVRMTQDAGLATLLHGSREGDRGYQNLHAFGLLERICQPDLVLGGANEMLARAIHEEYLRAHSGEDARANPSLVPWETLPDDIKESNRKQADHVGLKLQAVGCELAPLTEWDAGAFAFSPEEIERMAEMEHARWVVDRRKEGWTLGPRDPIRKTNPILVGWDDLPEVDRQFNRDEIRKLPDSLARAGFQIDRQQST